MKYKIDIVRKCSRCKSDVSFSQFSSLYDKLCEDDSNVVSFLKLSENRKGFIFAKGINLKKIWQNPRGEVFCPICLMDYHDALVKVRNCFKCGKPIVFLEAVWSKINKNYAFDELVDYWLNPIFQFYCCKCFKEVKQTPS